jgi:3-oxoadipate enol-lactonase
MLPKLLAPSTVTEHPEIVERVREMIVRTPVAGIVGALSAMRDRSDSEALLPDLAGLPTLVMAGEADTLTPPDQARLLAQAIPGAQLVIVPSAAHLPPVERPEEVNRILREFVRSI